MSVSRHVSSSRLETIECHDFEYFNGYHRFYCYPSDGILTSDYQIGFDTQFVDIFGNIYIDSCDLPNIIKVYSYPSKYLYLLILKKQRYKFDRFYLVPLCGIPEAYHNQSFHPKSSYYLVGQQVEYKCSDESYTLIGSQSRVCQYNGLWSGETPLCILGTKTLQRLLANNNTFHS